MDQRRICARVAAIALLCALLPGTAPAGDIKPVLDEEYAACRRLAASPVPAARLKAIQMALLLRADALENAVAPLLDDPDSLVRREAVRAAPACMTGRSLPALIARTGDPEWEVRSHAEASLRSMTGQADCTGPEAWLAWWQARTPEAHRDALLERLGSGDARQAAVAAEALRCLATPREEEQILQRLKGNPPVPYRARKPLLEALERIGTDRSWPFLAACVKAGEGAAAWAAGRRGGEDAEAALLEGFARNRGLDFLLNLDRLESARCEPFLPALCLNFHSIIRAGVGEDLRYPPSPLRRASAKLIRRTGQGPLLVDLILAEMEGKSREADIPPGLKPLFADLRTILVPEFVREGFSGCDPLLGVLPDVADDPALEKRLIPLLDSPCMLTGVYAAMTLGKLRSTAAVGPIVAVIDQGYPFSDRTAAASGKHTVEFRLTDGENRRQSQTVRWLGYLCAALGDIGDEPARLALERFATNPDAPRDVRYGAVVGLERLGPDRSAGALREVAANDEVRLIRDTARQVLDGTATTAETGRYTP